jgi:hypothetical protein
LCRFNYSLFFVVYFLVFSVCEGSLGLSILVSIIRSHGNDIFNLIVFFNVKVPLFSYFFNPVMYLFLIFMISLFINVFYFFYLFFFLSLFFCWGGLGYIFGCDLISYGLIFISL